MLVTAEEMLKKAKAGKYAVGQFNINNLEWTKAILATAQALQSPHLLMPVITLINPLYFLLISRFR